MSYPSFTKKNKPKVFLFFLLFATLLWVLTKFSKQYLATTNVNLEYINIPENTLLSEAPESVRVNLTANGFEFIFYRLKKPIIEINLNKYYKEGSNSIKISREALQIEISNTIDREVVISDASQNDISVELDEIANKEVPIIVDAKLNLQKGFRQVDSIKVNPSKVIVSAPSKILDSIDSISTVKWEAKNLNKNQVKKLGLKTPNFEKTFLDLEEVTATLEIREFTQKTIQVPIHIINKPKNLTLMLIPETLTLTTDIDIEVFNSISDDDFKIICDYNKRNEEEGILYAEISEQPKEAYNTRINEKTI